MPHSGRWTRVDEIFRELRKLKDGLATPSFVLNHRYGTDVIQAGESAEPVVELSEPNSMPGVRDVPA